MPIIGTKPSVNAFGATSPKLTGDSGISTMSVEDKEKFNGDSLGAIANKASDPNYVDPSKKVRATGNANLDKDAFFKMMLAQMKNQDPTNPLKSHEMAAQLANFSSLEQMQNVNKNLEEMKAAQKPNESFQSLNLIGKAVTGDSAIVNRTTKEATHEFKFNLPAASPEVTIKLTDAEGTVVRTFNLRNLKAGENKITWNGLNESGTREGTGDYFFAAEAKSSNGSKLAVQTAFQGVITGVSYSPEGPVLLVGQQSVRFRDVKKITDPRLMSNDQKVTDVTSQDLKKNSDTQQTESKQSETKSTSVPAAVSTSTPPKAKSNLNSVNMSREMMEKIAKETLGGKNG